MKKVKEIIDKSTPYRTLGVTRVTAPTKPQGEPKSTVTRAKGDLRTGGK